MKLAIVRQRYTPFGGAERFLERALDALGRSDLEITVIASEWPEGAASAYRRVLLRPVSLGRAWRDAAFARAACCEVVRGGYDLVQSHERISCCDVFRAGDGVHREWLIQRGRRRGALARGLDRFSPFHRRLLAAERSLFTSPRLKAVVCNSAMVRDEIVRHYGVEPGRLHVIPNGVDPERFHPGLRAQYRDSLLRRLDWPEDSVVFLLVGSGFERKGVDLLLDLWPRLAPVAHLVIVGRDRNLGRYQRRAEAQGLGARVRFVGPQTDVTPWYGLADVFALPTLYDPQPNAALEALACGLPLLTSTKCGAAELITPRAAGNVADALDAPAWMAMLEAWSDTARCAAARAPARAAVATLSLEALQVRYRNLYAHLLERS